MKIGIFGGCFNPPHKMHKDIAVNLINNKYVDKVIYVPTGNKYQKKELLSDQERYQMIELMIKDNENLLVSDYEFNTELTYTYQTLDYFNNKYKNDEIYFIMGADNLDEFDTWKNYQYILKNYKLLVINRGDFNQDKLLEKYLEYKDNIIFAKQDINFISSTYIRANINDDSMLKYLDVDVLNYIRLKKFYRR